MKIFPINTNNDRHEWRCDMSTYGVRQRNNDDKIKEVKRDDTHMMLHGANTHTEHKKNNNEAWYIKQSSAYKLVCWMYTVHVKYYEAFCWFGWFFFYEDILLMESKKQPTKFDK